MVLVSRATRAFTPDNDTVHLISGYPNLRLESSPQEYSLISVWAIIVNEISELHYVQLLARQIYSSSTINIESNPYR